MSRENVNIVVHNLTINNAVPATPVASAAKHTPLEWKQYREEKKAKKKAEEEKKKRKREEEEKEKEIEPAPKKTKTQARNARRRKAEKEKKAAAADKAKMEVDEKKTDPASRPYTCPGKMGAKWDGEKKTLVLR